MLVLIIIILLGFGIWVYFELIQPYSKAIGDEGVFKSKIPLVDFQDFHWIFTLIKSKKSLQHCIVLYYLTLTRCSPALVPFNSLIMHGTILGVVPNGEDFNKLTNLLSEHIQLHKSSKDALINTAKTKEEELLLTTIHEATFLSLSLLRAICAARQNKNSEMLNKFNKLWALLIESIPNNSSLMEDSDISESKIEDATILRGLFHKKHGHANKRYSGNEFLRLMQQKPTY
jgi:hypothetical protein